MNNQMSNETPQILIVEDQAIVAMNITRQLRQLGYQVTGTVAYGEEAIQKAEALHPDLVLMDIKLQGEMDGVEAAGQIHDRWDIPVIYITAHADEETLRRAKISAPFGYLLKPFKDRELEVAIEIALHQHRMEAELRQSEQRFRRLFEQSNDAIAIHDIEGRILDVNQRAGDILGYTREQLIGTNILDLQVPEEQNTFQDARQALWEQGEIRFETHLQHINTTAIDVEISASVIDSEKGLVQVIVRDITERKWAAAMLRQHNRRLALLNQAGQSLSASLDLDRVLLAVLEETRRLLEVTACSIWLVDPAAGDLVCQHATGPQSDMVEGWHLAPGEGLAGQVVERGESLIVPDAQADERHAKGVERETRLPIRAILTVPLKAKTDVIGVLQVVDTAIGAFDASDLSLLEPLAASAAIAVENARLFEQARQEIAERKRAEEALRESEERYRSLVNTSPNSIMVYQDGKYVFANPASARMLGFSDPADVIGMPALEIIAPSSRQMIVDRIQKIKSGEPNPPLQTEVLRTDGTTLWSESSSVPITFEGRPALMIIGQDITERIKAAEALRESEERYRTIFETAAVSIWEEDFSAIKAALDELQDELGSQDESSLRHYLETHPEFMRRAGQMIQVIDVNQTTLELFGARSKAEMLGTLDRVLLPETQDILREELVAIAKGRTHFAGETVNQTLQGKRRNVLVTMTIPPDPGKLDHVLVCLTDITNRVQTEEALRRSEASLAKAQRIAHIGSWDWHVDTNEFNWSDELYRIYGYDPEQGPVTFEMTLDPIHPADVPHVQAAIDEALNQSQPYQIEYWITLPNGEDRCIQSIAQVETGETGQTIRLHGTAQDVTAHKQAEAEREKLLVQIQDQAQQLQHVMDTVPEGVLLLDQQYRVILANPIARRDLLILADAGPGDTLDHLGDAPLDELLTSPPEGLWHDIQFKNRTFEIIARPIETSATPEGWVLVTHDATQEREIQKRVQRQERLASVGQLAAGIAHDFNNILAVISLYAKMLLRNPDLTEDAVQRLEIIDEQAWRASELIQQILDFSRSSVIERQPMDLRIFLKEQVKMFQRTLPENITIRFYYEREEAKEAYIVNADPTRLQQAVMNLVFNARDAMPRGGELDIRLARLTIEDPNKLPLPEMVNAYPSIKEWIRLTVADTGTGIPPDIRSNIFDPFFTTKDPSKGTGLGLAQVYGIVSQHEGYIHVESEVGEGAMFITYLPALPIKKSESLSNRQQEPPLGRGHTLLVVEDNEVTREAIVASLEMLNYRVLQAANGLQALDIIDEAATSSDTESSIALVLSDVVMPKMGGRALFQALKQRRSDTAGGTASDIKIVLMTGHPMEDELQALQEQGLDGWIAKPPSLEKLGQLIAQVIGSDEKKEGRK